MKLSTHRITMALAVAAATTLHAQAPSLQAEAQPTITGFVRDPLGAIVPGASVTLLSGKTFINQTTAQSNGSYTFALPATGLYTVRVSAPTFRDNITAPAYFTGSRTLDLTLATPTATQEITVSATGFALPEAQTGASVTLLPREDFALMTQVDTPLRLVPGVQVTQVGQLGGTTGLNIRGGETTANKVLLDGVPVDSIGGAVDFGNLATSGIDSIEVLREPNSALYGSDALAGVVTLSTRRGSTPLPLLTYAGDAGNFGTYRNEVTAGTAFRRFDLFSAFARLDTRNTEPNSQYHNATYTGNFGYTPDSRNQLRFSVHHAVVASGQPNAYALYGIIDDAQQKEHDNTYSAVWDNQANPRWHNQIRYGGLRLNGSFNSFGATGIPDGFGDFDGALVTINGANGYSVTGQAYFQFTDQPSQYLTTTRRDFVYAQTDYQLNPHLLALGAFKFEAESGGNGNAGSTPSTIARGNYSYTAQFSGDLRSRFFYTFGTGLEKNGLFGFAATPRASLAYYLVRPSGNGLFTGTKAHGTFSNGIKEPSIFQQNNSLYSALQIAGRSTGTVGPLGPESSRSYDAGLDQQLANGRARLGATYFHNQFKGGPQYLPIGALKQLYPGADFSQTPYGAYVTALAYRAQGLELEGETRLSAHLFARGGYTYTAAIVQKTTGTAATGTNFPTIQIGAYAPLVGARPFRIAPHTGYFGLNYSKTKFNATLTGTLVGRRDDSTFLTDANFGNSLLLPNQNLDGSYQRLELGGGYQLSPRISLYTNLQNLLSEHYYEAFGYPALPFTFRSGIKVNFGGESWKLR